jgi:hypothetical protein
MRKQFGHNSGYGEIEVSLTNPKGQVKFLRLNNVSYCPEFPTNLVSMKLLEDRGIDWDHRKGQLRFHGEMEVIGTTKRSHGQYVVSHSENDVYSMNAQPLRRLRKRAGS